MEWFDLESLSWFGSAGREGEQPQQQQQQQQQELAAKALPQNAEAVGVLCSDVGAALKAHRQQVRRRTCVGYGDTHVVSL